jgi:hypothetical protein
VLLGKFGIIAEDLGLHRFPSEVRMLRKLLICCAVTLVAAGTAWAQEGAIGAGKMEVGAFPGGGVLFMESGNGSEPNFANYALGGSFTLNFNKWVGVEGEGGGTIGVRQKMTFKGAELTDQKTPNSWLYMGNVVVNPMGNDHVVVPYGTAGMGGLTMCDFNSTDIANLGITKNETFLMGNAGGGMKWFATPHLGLRADYRLFIVKNKTDAPAFFGSENRYGHRVYGGLLLTY